MHDPQETIEYFQKIKSFFSYEGFYDALVILEKLFKKVQTGQLELLGFGRGRFVIGLKKHVLKFPLHLEGLEANYREYRTYRHCQVDVDNKYAPCQLYRNCILKMLRIKPLSLPELLNAPKWTYSVDCMQVGWDNSGNLLVYDYGG